MRHIILYSISQILPADREVKPASILGKGHLYPKNLTKIPPQKNVLKKLQISKKICLLILSSHFTNFTLRQIRLTYRLT